MSHYRTMRVQDEWLFYETVKSQEFLIQKKLTFKTYFLEFHKSTKSPIPITLKIYDQKNIFFFSTISSALMSNVHSDYTQNLEVINIDTNSHSLSCIAQK